MNIIKNKAPDLKKVSFKCDSKLHDRLDEIEIFKLMNRHNFTLFLGKSGSGKTSLLTSFLKSRSAFKCVYSQIFVFMPPNSRTSLKDNFFEKNLPEEQIFDDLNFENLQLVYDVAQENRKDDMKTLIILDDVQKSLRDPDIARLLLHMVNNRRHASLSIWMACQTYNSIPRQIRQGLTDLFVFKINKTEQENIINEVLEYDKKQIEIINKNTFLKPHDFFYINTNSQRIFSNFNEMVFDHKFII